MIIRGISLILILGAFFLPAQAQDEFTPAQRAQINSMIRAYILENPEIIPEAVQVLQQRDEERRVLSLGEELFKSPGGVIAGNPNGTATLVEFFDYRCPYCKRGWTNIKRLIDEDPELRVVFRQFPVKDGPGETISRDAALAAMAADRQGKYLEFHHAVFASPTLLTQERLMDIAKSVDLDMAQLKKDMDDPLLEAGLNQNMALAQALRLTGTPTYIIGKNVVRGLAPYDSLKAVIAQQRREDKSAKVMNGG